MIGAMGEDRLPDGVARVRADNPSPLTLDGTNTYVVSGWVVDPGPADERHLDAVLAAAGGEVAGIVLTHDHHDHSEGAPALAEHAGVAVERPDGGARIGPFEAIATPGHAPDHVALLFRRLLFTGDTVLGRGTSVIDPPEGDLVAYLRSLRRMRDLHPRTIHPGHGPLVVDAGAKLDEYVAHREDRDEQIVGALRDGPRAIDELVPVVYAGYPEALFELAGRSVLAHLLKLEDEGRAEKRTRDGVERWRLVEPRACARCGRPVRGRAKLCGSCSLAVLQETD